MASGQSEHTDPGGPCPVLLLAGCQEPEVLPSLVLASPSLKYSAKFLKLGFLRKFSIFCKFGVLNTQKRTYNIDQKNEFQ